MSFVFKARTMSRVKGANRLVKISVVQGGDDLELANYRYDGLRRRVRKEVKAINELEGTTLYYYNRKWQMLESRDGSENLDAQVIYGTRYVDEIVRYEKQDYGTMFVFQAECDR